MRSIEVVPQFSWGFNARAALIRVQSGEKLCCICNVFLGGVGPVSSHFACQFSCKVVFRRQVRLVPTPSKLLRQYLRTYTIIATKVHKQA